MVPCPIGNVQATTRPVQRSSLATPTTGVSGVVSNRKVNAMATAIRADPIRMAVPAFSAGRSGRSPGTRALRLGRRLGFRGDRDKRLERLFTAPGDQPFRIDVGDQAEPTDQVVR